MEYDTIVVGLGCAGAATVRELAKSGQDVLGIEQHSIVNEYGSSHGDIRLLRFAYHEGSEYVPYLEEAVSKWKSLEDDCGEQIFYQTGSATIGLQGETDSKLTKAIQTCEDYQIPHTIYSGKEFSAEYDGWDLPDAFSVVYEPRGGVLDSRTGIMKLVESSQEYGAEILTQTEVVDWEDSTTGVTVMTEAGSFSASNLVFTTGPWASELPELQSVLSVEKHTVTFGAMRTPEMYNLSSFPAFVFQAQDVAVYGAGSFDEKGVKVGGLSGGQMTPISEFTWDIERDEVEIARAFRDAYFRSETIDSTAVPCPLTHTPDGDFIIDASQRYPNVYYGVGLSGHGLKFAPVIGRLIADAIVQSEVVSKFSLERF